LNYNGAFENPTEKLERKKRMCSENNGKSWMKENG
jgi:hypothetical protein